VTAGDQLHLHVAIQRQMRGIWKYAAEARVDGEVVAEAELMCAKRNVA
ncbi:MAG TPA: 3-hydroxyacyl-[acyl-carrier-protein] dehydratase FabZ, partial [Accumulibacter sp.]|nr:3-hydroxyacyl-[acyl-carrier-protein] dehydratase FabZ [Accumulibacter sp.]